MSDTPYEVNHGNVETEAPPTAAERIVTLTAERDRALAELRTATGINADLTERIVQANRRLDALATVDGLTDELGSIEGVERVDIEEDEDAQTVHVILHGVRVEDGDIVSAAREFEVELTAGLTVTLTVEVEAANEDEAGEKAADLIRDEVGSWGFHVSVHEPNVDVAETELDQYAITVEGVDPR